MIGIDEAPPRLQMKVIMFAIVRGDHFLRGNFEAVAAI